eukprot:Nk52_evm21s1401 gene=Nk52_evmTU21s1401
MGKKCLVLVGGGHSHALMLHELKGQSIVSCSGDVVRVILISETPFSPYSGMLPGFIAGNYTWRDIHYDLRAICREASVEFFEDTVVGLDLKDQKVKCISGKEIQFDLLSINIGSTSCVPTLCSPEICCGVKPISAFIKRWDAFVDSIKQSDSRKCVGIVGGGVAGVEVTLCMYENLRKRLKEDGCESLMVDFHLFQKNEQLMPSHNASVRGRVTRALNDRNVHIHLDSDVQVIDENGITIYGNSKDNQVKCDLVCLTTGASPQKWVSECGLKTDDKGFICVSSCLESISHKGVFACGDISSFAEKDIPKSGVYAVRQAKPLLENIRRIFAERQLLQYSPQTKTLALINVGNGTAIASYGPFALSGAWAWKWKDRIDSSFMKQFPS